MHVVNVEKPLNKLSAIKSIYEALDEYCFLHHLVKRLKLLLFIYVDEYGVLQRKLINHHLEELQY